MATAIWNGAVLAESDQCKIVEENVYFPPESVKWQYFDKGDRQYTCPWKGESRYYNIAVGGRTNENAAWSYPEPKQAAVMIKGHVAFDLGKGVEVQV